MQIRFDRLSAAALAASMIAMCGTGFARSAEPASATGTPSAYDATLAKRLGADERGMRRYVLVVLKTGPTRVPDGPERDAMFAGHFANIGRLAREGKLAVAGPFSNDAAGWRGLFIFAVETIDEARALVDTDPVIRNGEMVPEFHEWYGSAATMLLPEWHERLVPPSEAAPSAK